MPGEVSRKRRRDDDETYAEKQARLYQKFIDQRIEDRKKGLEPTDLGTPRRLIEDRLRTSQDKLLYRQALEALPDEDPTEEQIDKISPAKDLGPKYLGRTVSQTNGYRFDIHKRGTNGLTTQHLMMPAADTNRNQALHADLTDLTQGELVYMVGQHLIWNDIPGDEFLSYSVDPLFLVVHGLNRYHENQGQVTIQFFDCRKAKNTEGEAATFFPALDIYEIFNVPGWAGWREYARTKLHPRKFTQEYLSHGTITVDDNRFQQAKVEDLIRDGLYDIFPAFRVPSDHLRAGLYTGQVYFRCIGYPPVHPPEQKRRGHRRTFHRIYDYEECPVKVPFTVEFLRKVQKLTRNFMDTSRIWDEEEQEPHLHIFLSFLTFQKRLDQDPVSIGWIKAHYTATDVTDLYDDGEGVVREGFTQVANNLPGVGQYLDLVRDATNAFGLPTLPDVVEQTRNASTRQLYADEDAKQQRDCVSSKKHDRDEQLDNRDKSKRSRKEKKDGKKPDGGSGVGISLASVLSVTTPTAVNQPPEDKDDASKVDTAADGKGKDTTEGAAVEPSQATAQVGTGI